MKVCHFFATTGPKVAHCTKLEALTTRTKFSVILTPSLATIMCSKASALRKLARTVMPRKLSLATSRSFDYPGATSHPHCACPRKASACVCPAFSTTFKPGACADAIMKTLRGSVFTVHAGFKTTQQVAVKQKRRKTNVVVALDVNSSMRGSNFHNAKTELNKLWNLLEKGESLSIITLTTCPPRCRWTCRDASSVSSEQISRNVKRSLTELTLKLLSLRLILVWVHPCMTR